MTVGKYLLWFALIAAWFGVITAAQIPIRKRGGFALRVIMLVAKFLLGIVVAYLIMGFDTPFIYQTGFYLAPLYLVLLADAAGDLLTLLCFLKRHPQSHNYSRLQLTVCALCVLAYAVFGTINMQTVSANPVSFQSNKLNHSYKFVFVTDVHVGSAQSMNVTESTIRAIAEEDVDFVLVGGDLVDEYTTKAEMEKIVSLLGTIRVPVYFIYGNHDRQPNCEANGGRTFSDMELETALKSNGIRILRDESVEVSDDLVLLGREAFNCTNRQPLSELPPFPEDAFVLAVDHAPSSAQEGYETRADLQLSGHWHAGQLFPLQFLCHLTGIEVYGFYEHEDTTVYVSSGACGWKFPLRTDGCCHYDVVTLEPKP